MKMIAINKYSNKLKDWSVKMPNAPYLNVVQKHKKNNPTV